MTKPTASQQLVRETLDLLIDGLSIKLATVRRDGALAPIVFLHGFGSTKEDYVDMSLSKLFSNRPFIAYDTPGSGESTMSDLSQLSMPLLVSIAEAVLAHFNVARYHLVGHSMGGLVSVLLLSQQQHSRRSSSALSFTNIKGNLAPEDCFLSRQILEHAGAADDPELFVDAFVERARQSALYGSGLYAAGFRAKVQAAAVRPTFESMVEFTDGGDLLQAFEGLSPLPRMYMFGEQYASLSYLPRLTRAGVEMAEIAHSGHFVMYSNPVAVWERIAQFLARVEH